MKLARYLFFTEAAINTFSIVLFLFQPQLMLQGLIADTAQITPLSLEMLRWYGAILLITTIMLWRALFNKNPDFLRFMLEAHLIGDIVYFVTQIQLANVAGWVFGTYFGMAVIFLFFLARLYYLWKSRSS
jgi:hypothetical protein